MAKKRTIIITEQEQESLVENILSEVFYPTAEKVLVIKDYLDKNFQRQAADDIDDNGYPKETGYFVMLSKNKQPVKQMSASEFLMMLDDKFHSMIKDDNDRKKFLKQVISDWFRNKISHDGVLSVNCL